MKYVILRQRKDGEYSLRRVTAYSFVWDICVGGIFWIWAIINTADRGFDAGVVSCICNSCGILGVTGSRFHKVLMIIAHVLVAANYGGVALSDKTTKMGPDGFRAYCCLPYG